LVYEIIQKSTILPSLFDREKVSIACIGGGPGSDFLGVLKYCLAYSKSPELKAMILDRDPTWSESWSDVDDKLGATFRISTICHPMDVTDPASWGNYTKHFQADLFTLIYFMSEVYASRSSAQSYFEALFANMKQGAIVLFVDNNSMPFKHWFNELATLYSVSIFDRYEGDMQMPYSEEKTDLGVYIEKFRPPKLGAKVAYRTAVKH
jgi:hypothetical protein